MTLKEKLEALSKSTDNLDELQEIIKEVESLETQLSEAKNLIGEHEAKIVSLQDTNHKLFLSATKDMSGSEKEDDGEKTIDEMEPDEAMEYLKAQISKGDENNG